MKTLASIVFIAGLLSATNAFSQTAPPAGMSDITQIACFAAPTRACLINEALALTDGANSRSANALLKSWLSAQLSDQALYDQASDEVNYIYDISIRNAVLQEISTFQAEAGFVQNAITSASGISDFNAKLQAIANVADIVKNDKLFIEISGFALRFVGGEDGVHGVLAILDTLAKNGHADAALNVANAIPDDLFRATALGTIGAASNNFDLVSDALTRAQTTNAPTRDLTLQRFPMLLLKAGNLDRALELINTFALHSARQSKLSLISVELAKGGRFEEAFRVAALIEPVIVEPTGQIHAIDNERADAAIIIALAKYERFEDALEMLQGFESDIWKDRVLAELAGEFAKAGQFEDAMAMASTIEHTTFYTHALLEIINIHIDNGALHEALSLAQTIETDYRKARAFGAIAMSLN